MAKDDLKDVFKQAAEIAKVVPEPMQDAAFNRALDLLQGEGWTGKKTRPEPPANARKESSVKKAPDKSSSSELADKINRTEHPEITDALPVLDRSLAVLRIAKDLGVDGLSAPTIAQILTDTFRIRTFRQNVNAALDDETRLVDRKKDGRNVSYRIMSRGEKFLDDGGSQREEATKPKPSGPAKKKATTGQRKAGKKAANTGKAKKQSAAGARPGPKAAIQGLIDAGYLKDSRTISELQGRLRTKLGHAYKTTDLSPALGRLLRQGELDRERNADGQFEYTAK